MITGHVLCSFTINDDYLLVDLSNAGTIDSAQVSNSMPSVSFYNHIDHVGPRMNHCVLVLHVILCSRIGKACVSLSSLNDIPLTHST